MTYLFGNTSILDILIDQYPELMKHRGVKDAIPSNVKSKLYNIWLQSEDLPDPHCLSKNSSIKEDDIKELERYSLAKNKDDKILILPSGVKIIKSMVLSGEKSKYEQNAIRRQSNSHKSYSNPKSNTINKKASRLYRIDNNWYQALNEN